ncbi:uncharacterized protein JCM6883_002849 [Sporobolomyces salmoneus]|uniref:uncharacterized protein n=1 Tax=Sporobolomyces salmoneus TaxID=183962 RepID=UPI00317146AD
MTEPHQVTLHTRLSSDTRTVPSLDPNQQLALRSLIQPREATATSYSRSPWEKHEPIEQTPNTETYTVAAPSEFKKLRPRSRSPSPEDWNNLSTFEHWVPKFPLPLPRHEPSGQGEVFKNKMMNGRAVAGAWSTTRKRTDQGEGDEGRKSEKRVRVESPATTRNRLSTAKEQDGKEVTETRRRSPRKVEPPPREEESLRRSSRSRKTPTKVLVPATPEDPSPAEDAELAIGAIKRCIPPPYHHIVKHDYEPPKIPSRQAPARIVHSFVDPSFTPSRSNSSSATSLGGRGGGGGGGASNLSTLSQKTAQFLIPGRQGSWLIPISAPFEQLPQASPPIWYPCPPPPPSPSKSTRTSLLAREQSKPTPIEWTDRRLSALWSFLSNLNESSAFGPLRAACHLHPDSSSKGGGGDQAFPEYLKITMDANLALAFRTMLGLFSLEIATGGGGNGKRDKLKEKKTNVKNGKGKEQQKEEKGRDAEKFLKRKALVWVDESGRAILVA